MSDNQNLSFGKFIPGFDFLQDLAKGASKSMPQLPNLSNWVAPTLNVEELEKRIGELKAVHFWLDQNSKALGATIQALEVQKMTLATLKGMNFNMGAMANALKLKPGDGFLAPSAPAPAPSASAPAQAAAAPGKAAARKAPRKAAKSDGQPAGGVVDPLQWWGALTQQFQQIAAGAMKDVAAHAAGEAAPGAGVPEGTRAKPKAGASGTKPKRARSAARKSPHS